jgi:hypothetical protein
MARSVGSARGPAAPAPGGERELRIVLEVNADVVVSLRVDPPAEQAGQERFLARGGGRFRGSPRRRALLPLVRVLEEGLESLFAQAVELCGGALAHDGFRSLEVFQRGLEMALEKPGRGRLER